ncbi:zonular occludens toxin domain-containing protein [Undibacterium sp. Dicai25W]|uniref:zonular occludens toxin domain-containing protein n=1 Tax=Undibacterium sp. Dicai25W TaxID=3413034 RepID=UPI003BF2525D
MSINAYVGLQGSGKSYEFVSGPMLDAIMQGRRVVTNVAGINEDLVHEHLVSKRDANADKLGKIIHVGNERISEPQFFPDEEKPELVSVVQGGDLVAIDEAWRFWGTDCGKLSHEHMQFFRMHRHYVHPNTSIACDVVLMTQDITGLHRSVKNVIEFAFRMQKHKSLGFTTRYRVEIYDGWKLNAKTRIDDRQKKYNPEIFPLYQSYTGGKGTETAIDKRQNILANKTFWLYAIGTVLFITVGGVSAWGFFHHTPDGMSTKSISAKSNTPGQAERTNGVAATVKVETHKPNFSQEWRYAGEYLANGTRWIVVVNSVGRLRVESPSMFQSHGQAVIGDIDGDKVTRWSGATNHGGSSIVAATATEVVK